MTYTSTWEYGEYDLDDIKARLLEICLTAELTAWAASTDQTKDILLTRAVQKLESLQFRGEKYLYTQDEQFPRVDRAGNVYDYIDDEYVIPQAIIDAIALEAVAILAKSSDSEIEDLQERGVKSVRISGTGLQYEFSGNATAKRGGFSSDRAYTLLKRYLATEAMAL
jgi:hypothetical protein